MRSVSYANEMRTLESPVGLTREAHPILVSTGTLVIDEDASWVLSPAVAAPHTESL